jgi:hypothetical protein
MMGSQMATTLPAVEREAKAKTAPRVTSRLASTPMEAGWKLGFLKNK